MKKYIALDVGTTKSAYAVMKEDYTLEITGILENDMLLEMISEFARIYDCLVYEEFSSYGMPIGKTTMESIKWNGRFIQAYLEARTDRFDRGGTIKPILRKDVKMNLCGTMKAKDSNIRQALIDRFGVVGTKGNKGYFYGVSKDMWSAIAICVTYIDKSKERI